MHTVASCRRDELGEHHSQPAVTRCATDVGLGRSLVRSVDDELIGGVVIRGGRLKALHVTAVADLGHGEAAGQGEGDDVGEVPVVMDLRAEVGDGTAEQTPVDAGLDQQRQVAVREHLEAGDRSADIVLAAVLHREGVGLLTGGSQSSHLLMDAGPVGVQVQARAGNEVLGVEATSGILADVPPSAVERGHQ